MNQDGKGAHELDLRGLDCPIPVVRTRDAMQHHSRLAVIVSGMDQAENIRRMAERGGWTVDISNVDSIIRVNLQSSHSNDPIHLQPQDLSCSTSAAKPNGSSRPVIAIGSDIMGRGSEELGKILIRSFLSTQKSLPEKPVTIVLFNSGVRLATDGSHVLNDLQDLLDEGIELLVCGTCLDYFHLKDQLRVGVISNMLDIAGAMASATHLINT